MIARSFKTKISFLFLAVCLSVVLIAPVLTIGKRVVQNELGDCPLCSLDVQGMVQYYGYPCERHYVVPPDGNWNLTMFRIAGSKNRNNSSSYKPGPPVLLQHGLLDSAATWVENMPYESLGFILADAGYDVWLGNNRGNTYATCMTETCWQFSYDEMALYDLPTFIGYVLNVTGYSQLSYVGHSEGTTQAFAGFSTLPQLATKVNVFAALAPAIFVNNQKSPLVSLLADLDVVAIFQLFGVKQFLPETWWLKLVAELFCNGGITTPICEDVIFALCGRDPTTNADLNQTRIEVYLTHTPAGTSVQNMAHWAQAVKSTVFQMYDYGSMGNFQHYGQSTPPAYQLGNFNVSTAFFSGGYDYLADPTDVVQLMRSIPAHTVLLSNYQEDYDHMDFVWGMDAHQLIYPTVVQVIGNAWNGHHM